VKLLFDVQVAVGLRGLCWMAQSPLEDTVSVVRHSLWWHSAADAARNPSTDYKAESKAEAVLTHEFMFQVILGTW
jgi:hypothetical protein